MKLFFHEDILYKFIVIHYYEMGQDLVEFYIKNRKLYFIYVKETKYNTHFMEDDFDLNKSEYYEVRSYFKNYELIHQICSKDSNVRIYDKDILVSDYFYYIDFFNEKSKVIDSLTNIKGKSYLLLR